MFARKVLGVGLERVTVCINAGDEFGTSLPRAAGCPASATEQVNYPKPASAAISHVQNTSLIISPLI
jgi:hypothetical protein